MELETPTSLLGRLKLGREEYCQRLLTMLILHGPYPRWNTRMRPSAAGVAFLRAVYEASFAEPWPGGSPLFVDEFELPARHDAERGGAPDYAVLWDDRVWLIELKTEKGSHRAGQIPGYFDLAHHHYPQANIDLLYITPPMVAPYQPGASWARYAHVTWGALVGPIKASWPSGTAPGEQQVVDGLLQAVHALHLKPVDWRAELLRSAPDAVVRLEQEAPADPTTPEAIAATALELALDTAASTAGDGKQRAVDIAPGDLETLLTLRLAVRDALAATPSGSLLRHVVPWIWRAESQGRPLTEGGRAHGMELRVSRYATERY